ncbi:MAG: hypothetical protein LAKADJCE_00935 [Candidatus Argoarchaeum ethanivorans]|uniref:Uncharacterized protein n=1 Tax=Candidatus Argoarchaeum ethanivorans TaxID=2608793 RepID=A0A811TBQ7_9EURY|nr:MAG: hypothetical protein LAKADJCE_00935 [Candidatus Argoarchaeum ethanivorans]
MFKEIVKFAKHEKECMKALAKNTVGGIDNTMGTVVRIVEVIIVLFIAITILSGIMDTSTLTPGEPLYGSQQNLINLFQFLLGS